MYLTIETGNRGRRTIRIKNFAHTTELTNLLFKEFNSNLSLTISLSSTRPADFNPFSPNADDDWCDKVSCLSFWGKTITTHFQSFNVYIPTVSYNDCQLVQLYLSEASLANILVSHNWWWVRLDRVHSRALLPFYASPSCPRYYAATLGDIPIIQNLIEGVKAERMKG